MTKFAILPTQEDQALFEKGRRPVNILMFEGYATQAEMDSFRYGMEAVTDGGEYEIVADRGLEIDLEIDGHVFAVQFDEEAGKAAYLAGLEAGEGYLSPVIHMEGTPEYEAIAAFETQSPTPPAMSTHGA